jgi:hypothetical protein
MALIQFKYNNYDFSDDVIDKVKAYIQTNNYPAKITTNYKKKLYDNKWKGFILKDNALFYEPEKLFVIKNDDKERILKQEYNSPNSAGLGYRQFYYLIASKYLNVKRKDVQDFLNRQPTY